MSYGSERGGTFCRCLRTDRGSFEAMFRSEVRTHIQGKAKQVTYLFVSDFGVDVRVDRCDLRSDFLEQMSITNFLLPRIECAFASIMSPKRASLSVAITIHP